MLKKNVIILRQEKSIPLQRNRMSRRIRIGVYKLESIGNRGAQLLVDEFPRVVFLYFSFAGVKFYNVERYPLFGAWQVRVRNAQKRQERERQVD